MTEEIIIDGVNVAGCNFRLEREDKQKCECTHATGFGVICDCENWHNCYFKQLKRLEQERDELKQENERLKKAYDEVSNNSEILHENHCLRIANAKLSEDLEQHGVSTRAWRYDCIKYKSALEEIRVIADDTFKICDDDCGNAIKIKLIADKINEVLE